MEETLNLSKSIISGNAQMALVEMNLTIDQTFSKPNIRTVFKNENGTIGFSVVNVLVNRFINSFGFSTKLSNDQIEILTVDTLENFKYESLEDIIVFFKMARTGKFGSTKKGVDSNLIYGEWYPAYLEQKADIREQQYQKEKNALNSKEITLEDVKKTYSKHQEKNFEKRVTAFVDKITKNIDRQILEDLITDWEKDPARKPYLNILKKKRITIK
ncbi:hypothetical protein B0A62_03170 [Flavobacterium hydatis]|uniref:Uncharacterized protein n=1 Tax=Flavobacterium hydatis TaxID=991 RepID=A0A086A3E6_FLAHY|nr:hypothetical protein IW20_19930 [Flavobacterium hydatis]OXA97872.1 hypothetical protein B0A62_03170 [Flavobacterium hydatis]